MVELIEIFSKLNAAGVPAWIVVVLLVLRWVGRQVGEFRQTIITEMQGVKDQLGEHVKTTERRLNLLELREELRRSWPELIRPPDDVNRGEASSDR